MNRLKKKEKFVIACFNVTIFDSFDENASFIF